jgi:hypothetical protein
MMEGCDGCPFKMNPMMMMMMSGDKSMKKMYKMMMMMKCMNMMKPGKCKKEKKEKKPKKKEDCCKDLVCLNKLESCKPFAGYGSGENHVYFAKMKCPKTALAHIKECKCEMMKNPKNKFVIVYADELSKEKCVKELCEIVESGQISVIRMWTDVAGEFHVCHYQKQCKDECKKDK